MNKLKFKNSLDKWLKLDCGVVINVIKQLLLKVNRNISILNHINTKKISFVVKEYEFIRPNINKIDDKFNKGARDCYKYFHIFKSRCIYNIEMINGDFVSGIISHKKIEQIVRENGFIRKLNIKIHSNLSNKNIC